MADFEQAWKDVVTLYHPDVPTADEVEAAVAKLTRFIFGNGTAPIPVKWGYRRTQVVYDYYTNPSYHIHASHSDTTWRMVIAVMAWVRWDAVGSATRSLDGHKRTLLREVVRRGWLAGTLIPTERPKAEPTKEQIRALKIARLEARIETWEKKQQRAENALKKLRQSLNAYRRHT